jgi:hypothetical protein
VGDVAHGVRPARTQGLSDRFQLMLYPKTAKALGLKVPQSVLLRVDEVIE